MIVTVTPNPAIDRTLEVDHLETGGLNRARRRWIEPSGKGVNVARALTVNGHEAIAVFPCGGVEGAQLIGLLAEECVACRAVPIAAQTRANVSILHPVCGPTKINEPGPALSADELARLDTEVAGLERAATWIAASGSLPAGAPPDLYARLRRRVHGRFALDSSGLALREGLAARPDLVKPNLEELTELAGRPLPTVADVVEAAEDVRRITNGAVLVTLGAAGAVLLDDEGLLHAAATVDDVRNPTGGGDSLLAGFLAGLDAGADRCTALREGIAWASSAVRSPISVGAPVSYADRTAVRITRSPDLTAKL